MPWGLNRIAGQHQNLCSHLLNVALPVRILDPRHFAPGSVHDDSRHRGFGEHGQIAGTKRQRNRRVNRSVLRIHLASVHAVAAVMAYRPTRP